MAPHRRGAIPKIVFGTSAPGPPPPAPTRPLDGYTWMAAPAPEAEREPEPDTGARMAGAGGVAVPTFAASAASETRRARIDSRSGLDCGPGRTRSLTRARMGER